MGSLHWTMGSKKEIRLIPGPRVVFKEFSRAPGKVGHRIHVGRLTMEVSVVEQRPAEPAEASVGRRDWREHRGNSRCCGVCGSCRASRYWRRSWRCRASGRWNGPRAAASDRWRVGRRSSAVGTSPTPAGWSPRYRCVASVACERRCADWTVPPSPPTRASSSRAGPECSKSASCRSRTAAPVGASICRPCAPESLESVRRNSVPGACCASPPMPTPPTPTPTPTPHCWPPLPPPLRRRAPRRKRRSTARPTSSSRPLHWPPSRPCSPPTQPLPPPQPPTPTPTPATTRCFDRTPSSCRFFLTPSCAARRNTCASSNGPTTTAVLVGSADRGRFVWPLSFIHRPPASLSLSLSLSVSRFSICQFRLTDFWGGFPPTFWFLFLLPAHLGPYRDPWPTPTAPRLTPRSVQHAGWPSPSPAAFTESHRLSPSSLIRRPCFLAIRSIPLFDILLLNCAWFDGIARRQSHFHQCEFIYRSPSTNGHDVSIRLIPI